MYSNCRGAGGDRQRPDDIVAKRPKRNALETGGVYEYPDPKWKTTATVQFGDQTGHCVRSGAGRWNYHAAAVEIARRLNPDHPRQVLEMGTMGVSIVKGSDTIDYAEKWNFRKFRPTFQHDARQFAPLARRM